MSKGRSEFCRWTALLLVFVFTFVSSGILMLRPQPVEAATIAQTKMLSKRISAGGTLCMAVNSEGRAVLWGSNYYGNYLHQTLGDNVVSVAVGGTHIMYLQSDGTVYCGLVPVNYYVYPVYYTVPEEIQGRVVAIAAGVDYAMALTSDGIVHVWGYNNYGIFSANGVDNVMAIATERSSYQCMVLKNDGSVHVFGGDPYGGYYPLPAGVQSQVVSIAISTQVYMALRADGTMVNWGAYGAGLTGSAVGIAAGSQVAGALKADGTVVFDAPSGYGPAYYQPPPGIQGRIVAIDVASYVLAILSDGSVVVWGQHCPPNVGNIPVGLNVASKLSKLKVGYGAGTFNEISVSPSFSPETTSYTAIVPEGASSLAVIPTLENPNAIVRVNGNIVNNGSKVVISQREATITVDTVGLIRTYTVLFKEHIIPDARMKIAAGGNHCLALKSDGTVVAWGYNEKGQASVPAGLANVVDIAAGENHSLGLKADGSVIIWGYTPYGQFTSDVKDVVSIAAGSAHSLALKLNGTVAANGANLYGLCNVPVGLGNVIAIAASSSHNLALKADGEIVGWGNNDYGQCDVPAGLSGVVAIGVGSYYSLALKSDGTVVAWGHNGQGQCDVAGLKHITSIAAGYSHSLALKADRTVVAWGDNGWGQCNVPSGIQGRVVEIAVGQQACHHSMALKIDGTVEVWGYNGLGQCNVPAGLNLGGELSSLSISSGLLSPVFNPAVSDYALRVEDVSFVDITATLANSQNVLTVNGQVQTSGIPQRVAVAGGTSIYIGVNDGFLTRTYTLNVETLSPFAIAQQAGKRLAINEHSLALQANGTVVSWGNNSNGQRNVPAAIQGSVVEVKAGNRHSLGLKADGTVSAWGLNTNGQCNVPAGLNNVVALSAGRYNSMALKADGTAVGWGANPYGQCNIPSAIQGSIVAIESGGNHSGALKADGTVTFWGYNGSRQCNIPLGLNNVVAIAAGLDHSVALKADGTLVAWGNNGNGQCNVPASIQGNVVDIVADYYHNLALLADGTVVGWGFNTYGQCNVPSAIQGNVVAIAAGQHSSQALLVDGTVVAWGWNNYSQCKVPAGLNLLGGLNALTVSCGSLSPVFNKNTLTYSAPVNWDITSTNVTAVADAPGKQELSANGVKLTSGVLQNIPLGSSTLTIDVKISTEGLQRTYVVTISPVYNLKLTDFGNLVSIKSVLGAQILSKLGFNLHQGVNSLTISLDFPVGFEIACVDGLYKSGVRLAIATDKFVIAADKVTINTPLQAGIYELKFVLQANTIKVPIIIKSFMNQAGKVVTPTGESLKLEYVDLPSNL